VHGPGQRVRREIRRGSLEQRGQVRLGQDGESRLGVGHQTFPLGLGQRGIEKDRDNPDPGGTEHGADQVGRRSETEDHPVPGLATTRQQRAGGPPLTVLGIGRAQHLDCGRSSGHSRSVPTAVNRSRETTAPSGDERHDSLLSS
jgi:hypothetical protein